MGSSSRMPTIATGTTGTPALMAMYAGPSLNSRSPSAERPPSGKFNTETPRSADDARRFHHALQRSARVRPVHRHVSGALQVRAQKRNAEQALLGEKAELLRQRGQQRRNVHEAAVIGHEHVGAARIQLLQPFDAHPDEADREQHPGPRARQLVLRIPRAVEERSDQRKRSHHDGADDDQGRGEEQRAEETHRFAHYNTSISRASATRNREPVMKIDVLRRGVLHHRQRLAQSRRPSADRGARPPAVWTRATARAPGAAR